MAQAAVGAGDRPAQDRDRALAERGRLSRGARLGGVDGRRQREAEAADAARAHLNHALAINPDHAAAHDYKGRIDAALRVDDAERAVSPRARDRSRSDAHRGDRDDREPARRARRAAPAGARAQAPAVPAARQGRHRRGDGVGAARDGSTSITSTIRRPAPAAVANAQADRAAAIPRSSRSRSARRAVAPRHARADPRGLARGARRSADRRRARAQHGRGRSRRRRVSRGLDDGRARHRRRARWRSSTSCTASRGVRLPARPLDSRCTGRCCATATTPSSSAR